MSTHRRLTTNLIVAAMIFIIGTLAPMASYYSASAEETVTICDNGRVVQQGKSCDPGTNPGKTSTPATTTSPTVTTNGTVESLDWNSLSDADHNGVKDDNRLDLSMAPGQGDCPAEGTMWVNTGVKVQANGGCSFKWNAVGVGQIPAVCPSGYGTYDLGGVNGLYVCDNPVHLDSIEAGTWFPVKETFSSPCAYYLHELAYVLYSGNQEHLMDWVPMNFDCVISNVPEIGTLDTRKFDKNKGANDDTGSTTQWCSNIIDAADAANKIGGDASQWSNGDPNDQKIVFSGPATHLVRPDGQGSFDTYQGSGLTEDVDADNATYNCPAT